MESFLCRTVLNGLLVGSLGSTLLLQPCVDQALWCGRDDVPSLCFSEISCRHFQRIFVAGVDLYR